MQPPSSTPSKYVSDVILHLLSSDDWSAIRSQVSYSPDSLHIEGFVHCTGELPTMLQVANRFYSSAPGAMVVVELDEAALSSEVRWEPPAHPDGSPVGDDERRFPHVYGPLDLSAVRAVRLLVRATDGTYVGVGEPIA
jgi:uncharacterized protein